MSVCLFLVSTAHDPELVSDPIYPVFIPLEDGMSFQQRKEQPLPPVDSPMAESPDMLLSRNPEWRIQRRYGMMRQRDDANDEDDEDGEVEGGALVGPTLRLLYLLMSLFSHLREHSLLYHHLH
ncbi:hypothetical protein Tco_0327165 [Tanacetum coccineum]